MLMPGQNSSSVFSAKQDKNHKMPPMNPLDGIYDPKDELLPPKVDSNGLEGFRLKYDQHISFKDRWGNECEPPSTEESLDDFLFRVGYKERDLEGHSQEKHAKLYRDLVIDNNIKSIVEIGFNAGHSARTFLDISDDVTVTSFDIMHHDYSQLSKQYIDTKYPGRHTLIAGNSTEAVPNFVNKYKPAPVDLIFIDGDHRFEPALRDIVNCKGFADMRTMLIIDNVAPHRGCGFGTFYAWRRCVEMGFLNHLHHYEVEGVEKDEYSDGWTLDTYVFPENDSEGVLPNYERMMRKMKVAEIMRKMDRAQTSEELSELESELWEQPEENIDNWCEKVIKKNYQRIAKLQRQREGLDNEYEAEDEAAPPRKRQREQRTNKIKGRGAAGATGGKNKRRQPQQRKQQNKKRPLITDDMDIDEMSNIMAKMKR
eukprot:TRINITY_DN39_c2_g2_i1.p1 TRINITY_DN39_c2_g2~~TRINITY_DN39_c2_g2_i1.p1  ORF type:complete len:426 (-),score=127.35 TRINITY_DN39_c2_g2_i1:223-1500(-)